MKLLLAVCLVAVLYSTVAQATKSCTADKVKAYKKCLRDAFTKDGPKFDDQDKEKFKQCFTSGCKTPGDKPTDKQADKPGKKECFEGIRTAKKAKLDQCIQKQLADYDASVFESEQDGAGKWKLGRGKGHWGGWNESCKEGGNATKLRECIRGLRQADKKTDAERKAKFDQVCKAKEDCGKTVGADCLAELQKVRQVKCECLGPILQDFANIRKGVAACAAVPEPAKKFTPKKRDCSQNFDLCKDGYEALKKKFEDAKDDDNDDASDSDEE